MSALSGGKHSTLPVSSRDHKSDQLPLMPAMLRKFGKYIFWKYAKNYHKIDFVWRLNSKNVLHFKLEFFSQTYVMRSFWKYFWRCILGGWYTVAAVVFYGLSLVSFVGFLLLTKGIQLWPHFYNLVKFGQNKNQVEIWHGFLKEFEMLLISWFNEDWHFRDSPKSHITCQSNQS